MRKATRLCGAMFALAFSGLTLAQWNPGATARLGMGFGQIALSQSILGNTRRIGNEPPPAPAAAKPASSPVKLTYNADPALSAQTRAVVIDTLCGTSPQLRGELERAFAGDAALRQFDSEMSARGYSSHNIADDTAELLLLSWQIVTDGTPNSRQVQGAHQQIRAIFLGTTKLVALRDADRQDMAERIAYQFIILSSARQRSQKTGDPSQLARLKQQAASAMRQQGIEISRLRLTDQGFKRDL
jgi:Family of unknown function (DUF6683)